MGGVKIAKFEKVGKSVHSKTDEDKKDREFEKIVQINHQRLFKAQSILAAVVEEDQRVLCMTSQAKNCRGLKCVKLVSKN